MSLLHRLSLVVILMVCAGKMQAQNIDLSLTGIRSAKGSIIVKVFTDEKSFHDEKAVKALKFKKTDLTNGQMATKLSLDPGVYGFALLDDENDNAVMEYNFVGMPKEGFGFSNYYLSGMKKPHFEDFKFTVGKGQNVKVVMKLRYM